MENKVEIKSAEQIIKNHAWLSTAPGFLPIPFLDMIAISAIQVDMVKQLCTFYGKEYNEEKGKTITLALMSTFVGRIPGYLFRSLFKSVPGIGWALGGLSLSAFAMASTYATGQVFKEHFDQNGTLHDLNPENFQKFYKEQFEKAKVWVNKSLEVKPPKEEEESE